MITLSSLGSAAYGLVKSLKDLDVNFSNVMNCHSDQAFSTFSEVCKDFGTDTARALYKEHSTGAAAEACGAAGEHAKFVASVDKLMACQAAMSFMTMAMAIIELKMTLNLAAETAEFRNNSNLPHLTNRCQTVHQEFRAVLAKIQDMDTRPRSLEELSIDLSEVKDELTAVHRRLMRLLMEVNTMLNTSKTFRAQLEAQRRKGAITTVTAAAGTGIQVYQFLALRAIGAMSPVGWWLAVGSIAFQGVACIAGAGSAAVAQKALTDLAPFVLALEALHTQLSEADTQAEAEITGLEDRLREIRVQRRAAARR